MQRLVAEPTVWRATEADVQRTRIHYWWLLLVIAFEYVRPGAFVPVIEATKINSLIPLILFAIVLFAPGLRPFKEIFLDRAARWIILYLGLILLSVPMVEVTLYAVETFKKVFAHFTLFLIIARVTTTLQRLRGIFLVLVVAHLFVLAMNPDIILKPDTRSYVQGAPFLGDGNDFSLSLCIIMPMAIELTGAVRSKLARVVAWAAVLVVVLAIVGTQSRGAAVAGCAMLGFLWLTSKQKGASLLGIGVVAAIVMAVGSQTYFDRMSTIRDYQSEGSAQARVAAWKAATRMALDHPLLGVGAGQFPMAYGTKYRAPDSGGRWMTAHSMYFLVLAELGLPGIVAFCSLVFGGILATLAVRRRLLHSSADPPSEKTDAHARVLGLLAASGVGFAVAGAFLSVAYYPHVFVLTGILLSARRIALASITAEQSARFDRPQPGTRYRRRPGPSPRRSAKLRV